MFSGINNRYLEPTVLQRVNLEYWFAVGETVEYVDSNSPNLLFEIKSRRVGLVNGGLFPRQWYSGTLFTKSPDGQNEYFTTITNAPQSKMRRSL